MPGKPSRRDRRRSGRVAPPADAAVRRPRPAPPVSPARVIRIPGPSTPAPERERPPTSSRPAPPPATPAPRAERRVGTSPARLLEAQREQRVQREALRDIRRISIVAGGILVLLVAFAVLLP